MGNRRRLLRGLGVALGSAALGQALGGLGLGGCGPGGRPGGGGGGAAARVDLWFAGDLHLGELGPEILAPLRGIVPPGALGILNLEGPLATPALARQLGLSEQSDFTGAGPPGQPSPPRLWSASDTPAILRELGVAAVGIANNHHDDLGAAGRRATLGGLRAAGLVAVGGDAGVGVLDRGGLRIALTAHALGEAESIANDKLSKKILEELVAARRGVDHLIATFHIDGPPSYLPPPGLRRAAELAVDAGAVAVIAHGSHAIAGVERRGRALIAYGLGNLAFACRCTDEVDAAILTLTLDRQGLAAAAWIPIAAGLHGRPLAAHPDPDLLFELLRSVSRGRAPGRVGEGRYHLELAGAPAQSEGSL